MAKALGNNSSQHLRISLFSSDKVQMVVLESLAVMFEGAFDLFRYNRVSFQFDVRQEQERLYHLQKMRNEQGQLYREDMRDLFGLTVGKMETYLIVATITSLLTIVLIYEGRVPPTTPAWLFLLWAASSTSAVCFLLLSQWLAIQASVAAQVGRAQSLTSFVRLPVPSTLEINKVAPALEVFETTGGSLRLPFTSLDDSLGSEDSQETDSHSHFAYFVTFQRQWITCDAYARVSLILGTNQLMLALGYTGVAYFAADARIRVYWAFVAVLASFGAAHAYINLLVRFEIWLVFTALYFATPLLACTAYAAYRTSPPFTAAFYIISSASIFCQFTSLGFLVVLGLDVEGNMLPTRFATVNQIDVVGAFGLAGCKRELVPAVTVPAAPVITREADAHLELRSGLTNECDAYRSFKSISAVNLLILFLGFVINVLAASGVIQSDGWSNAPNPDVSLKQH
jgi:hypothetical protein